MTQWTQEYIEKAKANPDQFEITMGGGAIQRIRKKPRPSPRTLGKTVDPITGEEVFFTKFGTQQLKFIDPAKPALGVKQIDVKPTLRIGWFDYGTPTVRNTAYPDLTITKGVGTTTPAPFNGNGNGRY